MTQPDAADITSMLVRWANGERECLEVLAPAVQHELNRIARNLMRKERPDHTLQTTAVVNEAYLRLIQQGESSWQNRAHFFAVAARLMRQILVDYARQNRAQKRGGALRHIPIDEALVFSPAKSKELIALDEALTRLTRIKPRLTEIVELRYFGGLNVEEAAEVLKVHPNTVIRDWTLAKAWLKRELEEIS
jgi:RNA polymerase sigma factor (TIGR02999 family)